MFQIKALFEQRQGFRKQLPLFFFALLGCAAIFTPCHAENMDQSVVTVRQIMTVDEVGNADFTAEYSFKPARIYDRFKQANSNLYVTFRDYISDRDRFEIDRDSIRIDSDDQKRVIILHARFLGKSIVKKNHWVFGTADNEDLVTQDDNKVFTSSVSLLDSMIVNYNNTYIFPDTAQNIVFNKTGRQIVYDIPFEKGKPKGEPKIDIAIHVKQQIMSALYKIYANPEAEEGFQWVAKSVITNDGKDPIFDLKVYYKLANYTEMNVPDKYSMIMPGGTVVDLYYPIIASQVVNLKTKTPTQLYIKCEYKDVNGETHTEEYSERIDILGINQFVWTDLPDNERQDNWEDYFRNASLIAAFVTRMDDSVKQFAGYVSEASGGAGASLNDDSAKAWLKAAYNLEIYNNFAYQTPSGYMTTEQGIVQDLKYPRDVFRDKSGTCVDLAITFAALAESTGLHSYIILYPGHAFTIIELPSGDILPVETTGIGGGKNRLSFEDAVATGSKEWKACQQSGEYIVVNVSEELNNRGIPNPELPAVGPDFLPQCGIKRMNGTTTANPSETTEPNDVTDSTDTTEPADQSGDDQDEPATAAEGNDSDPGSDATTGATQNTTASQDSGNDTTQIIFSDDFSRTNSGWDVSDQTYVTWKYANGEYVATIKSGSDKVFPVASPPVQLPAKYIAQVDAVSPGEYGRYGIAFNFTNASGDYYAFIVDEHTCKYAIVKRVQGSRSYVLNWTACSYIKRDAVNTIAIVQIGNQVWVAVNGQVLGDPITVEPVKGQSKVGLCIGNGQHSPVTVRFDNFKVGELKG